MTAEQATMAALSTFRKRLNRRYGPRLRALYLFGSRARGDHRPDSDLDVAVVLDAFADPIAEGFALDEEGTPVLLEHSVRVQAWPFEERELADPEHARAPALLGTILREGVRL
ncbi:MAG: nucleotidyltransferase domain-containing protein [Nitrococcus sp.]|nr:nucleotidyltransferase domain-containing protein [Nitrococcus sp.]